MSPLEILIVVTLCFSVAATVVSVYALVRLTRRSPKPKCICTNIQWMDCPAAGVNCYYDRPRAGAR